MRKAGKAYISFFRLKRKERREVIPIIVDYTRVSFLIRFSSLRKYYDRFFRNEGREPFDFLPYTDDLKLIKKVIRRLPGKYTCLKESLVVFLYFNRQGIQIPLYLGVSTKEEFRAHAWYDENNSNGFDVLDL